VFAASTGARPLSGMGELMELCHLAGMVMARAIARGVYEATALPYEGAQSAWRDRYPDRR
jgi:L-aminopeptidase/D-esterase-like protein